MPSLSQVIEFKDGAKGIPLGTPGLESGNFMDRIANNPEHAKMVMTALKTFPATAPYARAAELVVDGAQAIKELGADAAPKLRKLFAVPAADIQGAVNAKGAKTPTEALQAAVEAGAEPENAPQPGKRPRLRP
ncbi:MAG: hypothetical protein CVV05_01080 [Gammaproteobacteria bacterium HGW-Gammaproteobacteria-1]|jgi:uncharacterized protein (DUF697 family)|nr:MAG: hypothetical protein CVV05_01080 [Gammaproteobacteria bacterium HGW-Gammaproteobacteria-1]